MIRRLAVCFGIGLAFTAATVSRAVESFPVVHNEPIVVRVLNGADGAPLVHVHLNLFAGYDEADIKRQTWHEETLTNDQGQASLSNHLANLPFLQVWPTKMRSCQGDPRNARFSVERIRRDGLSTPNRCGVAMVKDAPGVFTVYVFVKAKKKSKGQPVVPTAPVVKSDPAEKPSGSDHSQPAPAHEQPPASVERNSSIWSELLFSLERNRSTCVEEEPGETAIPCLSRRIDSRNFGKDQL